MREQGHTMTKKETWKETKKDTLDLGKCRILVTGAHGFLGRHLVERLKAEHPKELIIPTSKEYDLTDEAQVSRLFDHPAQVGNVGRYLVQRALIACEFEQGGGVPSCNAGYNACFG